MKKIISTGIPLPAENIDTDQIIPSRFLKVTGRAGFGDGLFYDRRFTSDGKPKKDFVLNNSKYKGQILVAGRNFASGSSREHAAWALLDYGFKAVVSSFFADIFKNNALTNGLLPIQVSDSFLQKLFAAIEANSKTKIVIDIPKQIITIAEMKESEQFPLTPYRKLCLTKGYDDIGYALSQKNDIKNFEKLRKNDFSLA